MKVTEDAEEKRATVYKQIDLNEVASGQYIKCCGSRILSATGKSHRCGSKDSGNLYLCIECYEAEGDPFVQKQRRDFVRTDALRAANTVSCDIQLTPDDPVHPGPIFCGDIIGPDHHFCFDCWGEKLAAGQTSPTPDYYHYEFKGLKLDPYRICEIYKIGGGPREHMIKKLLRGGDKGHEPGKLISELQSALDRWREMLNEDCSPDG